jgi:uncharacterized protein (TIGR02246 family)
MRVTGMICSNLLGLSLSLAGVSGSSYADTQGNQVKAILGALSNFEDAWDRGDIANLKSQYDPSMVAIQGSDYVGYEEYMTRLTRVVTGQSRGRVKLDVNAVRMLDSSHALVSGRTHFISVDGKQESSGLFTAIYGRSKGKWRILYAHA